MAKAAAAAPATMPDEDDDDQTGTADDQTENDEGKGGEDEGQPERILSVWCNPDGSYTLTKGDEDEDEEGEDTMGGDEGEGGAEPGEEGGEQHFPGGHAGEGQLLKAVLQTVRDYEAEKSGTGTAEENFKNGYGEEPEEPQLQKYQPQ